MKTPCMIVAQRVLPSIRSMIVEKLLEEHKMRQSDVSALTKLTPAAIAQYAKGKRGTACLEEIAKSKETMKAITGLVEALAKDYVSDQTTTDKLCQVCRTLRSEGICGLDRSSSSL